METTHAATDDLTRSIDQQMARAEAAVAKARAHADRIQQLRGRGSYRGVHVVVDAGGMLTDIRFDEATRGTVPATLAHACQMALRAACNDVHAAARSACIETDRNEDTGLFSGTSTGALPGRMGSSYWASTRTSANFRSTARWASPRRRQERVLAR